MFQCQPSSLVRVSCIATLSAPCVILAEVRCIYAEVSCNVSVSAVEISKRRLHRYIVTCVRYSCSSPLHTCRIQLHGCSTQLQHSSVSLLRRLKSAASLLRQQPSSLRTSFGPFQCKPPTSSLHESAVSFIASADCLSSWTPRGHINFHRQSLILHQVLNGRQWHVSNTRYNS